MQLLAGQQRVAVLEEANREMEWLQTIINGKENAGTASRYDVMRIAQEVQRLKARLDNAHTDIAGNVGELGVLLGISKLETASLRRIGAYRCISRCQHPLVAG